VLPADLFTANEKATFPHEKRDIAVDFHYPTRTLDALRVNFPANFSVEASPSAAKFALAKEAAYGMNVVSTAGNFTTRREYDFSDVFILADGYPQLRTFYSQFEGNDHQSIILKSTTGPTVATTASPGSGD
jgi:hypothetical protein